MKLTSAQVSDEGYVLGTTPASTSEHLRVFTSASYLYA